MYVAVPPGYYQRLCRLDLSPLAMVVALAMRSFDGHAMTGLHQLQAELRVILVGDFQGQGMTAAKAAKVIEELTAAGFWRYSDRVLWVCDQADHLGRFAARDTKRRHVQNHIERIGPHPVVTAFVERYGEALGVTAPVELARSVPAPAQVTKPKSAPLVLDLVDSDGEPAPKDGITKEQWVEIEKAMHSARERVSGGKARKNKFTPRQRKEVKQLLRAKNSDVPELTMVILRMGEGLRRWADDKPDEAHRPRALCSLSHLRRGTNFESYRDNPDLDTVRSIARGPPGLKHIDLDSSDYHDTGTGDPFS